MDNEKCCGNCERMIDQDTYGWGFCLITNDQVWCSDKACETNYVPKQEINITIKNKTNMNADLEGMWYYYFRKGSKKRCNGIIVTEKGKWLTHNEAMRYVKYCLNQGYTHLKECPEYEDIINKI